MAPPPVVDLFDWRVPNVDVLAMICVSRVYESDAFADGLRRPPLTGRPSPAATANGVISSAAPHAATTIQGPLPRPGRRRRMRVSIGESTSLGGRERQARARGTACVVPASPPPTGSLAGRLRSCKAAVRTGRAR